MLNLLLQQLLLQRLQMDQELSPQKLTQCNGHHQVALVATMELISGGLLSLVCPSKPSLSQAHPGVTILQLTLLITRPGESLKTLVIKIHLVQLLTLAICGTVELLGQDLDPVEVEDNKEEPMPGTKIGTMIEISSMTETDLTGAVVPTNLRMKEWDGMEEVVVGAVVAPINGELQEVTPTMVQVDGDPHLSKQEVVDGVAILPQVLLLDQELLSGDKTMTTIVQQWLAGLTMVELAFGVESLLQECQVQEQEEDQVDPQEVS